MEREKLIELQRLLNEIFDWNLPHIANCVDDSDVKILAKHLIANGVTVRQKGHLIFHEDMFGTVAECSCCHVQGMLYGNFCVHCGADMRGDT